MTAHRPGAPVTGIAAPSVRLYEIDLLRIGAALSVVGYHYLFSGFAGGLTDVAYPTASLFARYGYLGVDLFFVISGFVVLMSAWERRPAQFVISRMVRLYPAYWVGVTLTSVVTVLVGGGLFTVTLGQYLANLTMLNSLVDVPNIDVVYWTLWAELRFYALVLVLTVIGMTRRRVLCALWLWLAATAAMQIGLLPPVADLVVQSQFSHYFVAGMALFLVHRFGPSLELAAVVALSLANAVLRGTGFAAAVADRYHETLYPGVVAGIIVAIFVVMALVALGVTRRLRRPSFAVAGNLTYPLYLIHAHLGFILFGLLGGLLNRWVLVIGLVAAVCLVAHGIHVLVERPLAPRLKALLTRWAGPAAARR